jgi:cytoskeleton protein RodZ
MDSIGETLRGARLRRGLRLEQMSAHTKIGLHHLQAMEMNQFDRLPGGLFTRSFLRQYSHALDLNEEEIIGALKQQFEQFPVPLSEPQPSYKPSHRPRLPTLAWLAIAIFTCGGIFTLRENGRRSRLDTSVLIQRPIARAGRVIPDTHPAPPSSEPLREVHTIEEPPPMRSQGQLGLGSVAPLHVVFAATEPVWLSIKCDGIHTYSGTIEGLQSKEFDASTKMAVLVGNAGGLTIAVNGKSVALTGNHGEVKSLVVSPNGVQVAPPILPTTLAAPEDHSALPEQRENFN